MPLMLDDPPRAEQGTTPIETPTVTAAAAAPEVTVRVVTEHAPTARRRRLPRPGNVLSTLVALALTVAILLAVGVATGFLHLGNPFATTAIDRSPPAVLKKLTNLSAYSAAQGRYQQTIDVEDDVSILPSFLAGEHTVFVAQGAVDAQVDFSRLSTDAVQTNGDTVTVNLPEPTLAKPVIDMGASRVASHDRGLLNRVGAVFTENPNAEQRFYKLAQAKIAKAATQSQLTARAEVNTTKMLQGLLGKVGFSNVQVNFVPATTAAGATR
ncbi:MAG: DUF4230 domain-containing protein [Acidimicrobiia bacterium]